MTDDSPEEETGRSKLPGGSKIDDRTNRYRSENWLSFVPPCPG